MPVIPANLGHFSWNTGRHRGEFHPHGPVEIHGEREHFDRTRWRGNPTTKHEGRPASVRLFVGFNVGKKQRWKLPDVVKIVKRVRMRQVGDAGATFISQLGMYTHHGLMAKRGTVVTEKGVQVLIVNLPHMGVTTEQFEDQMNELGEDLCRELKQETIFAEWQHGDDFSTWEIVP